MDIRSEKLVMDTLLEYLDQPERCDVKFNVHLRGDAWMPFWGHSLILKIWSPVFEAFFSEKESEKSLESFFEIDIKDFPATVFKHFLRFLYGSSEGIDDHKSNGKFLLDLYKLAELYQVEQLKKECREILITSTVEVTNVFQFLKAANYINLESVKLRCFELLRDKTAEVIAEQDFKKVTSTMVFTILTLHKLSLPSEYDLMTWVFDWAESQCYEQPEVDPKNIVEPFMPYLNFASLKAEQFGALVNKHKWFFREEDGFRIFLNICVPGPNCLPLPDWYDKTKCLRSYKVQDYEHSSSISSDNLLRNDTQRDTTPVEVTDVEPVENLGNVEDNAPTELANTSVKESNSSANKIDSNADNPSSKNTKPQGNITKYEEIDFVDPCLSECLSLNQVPTDESEDELNNYHSLKGKVIEKKIKKKKIKTSYLLPDGKSKPQPKSINLYDNSYSSGDFEKLIGSVWKQHRLAT